MRADITNIPISEVFEEKDGCPICRMRNLLEQRMAEYITGAAMMEPDVRMETNRMGFCYHHFGQILKQRNRLGVALILESHLEETEKNVFKGGVPLFGKSAKAQAKNAASHGETCFVCSKVDWAMERMLATVCRLWETERDFKELFAAQECLCLPHFTELINAANKTMNKHAVGDFSKAASTLSKQYLETLREDVSHFCKMFDYRNSGAGADWGNSRDAVERAVWYLTGREP